MSPTMSTQRHCGAVPAAIGYDTVEKWVRSDGSIYSGQTLNGQPEGRGRVVFPSGAVIAGDFARGKAHGRAIETRNDGTEYNGEFRHGRREGRGQLRMADGGCYVGRFFSGCFQQHGLLIRADGSVVQDKWSFGRVVGPLTAPANAPSSPTATPAPAGATAPSATATPHAPTGVWMLREGAGATLIPAVCVNTPPVPPPPTTPLSVLASPSLYRGPPLSAYTGATTSPLPPWQPPPASVLQVWEQQRKWQLQHPGPVSPAPLFY